jgi:AcrB/AcrD/AcrF family
MAATIPPSGDHPVRAHGRRRRLALGLLPAALSTEIGSESQRPLAVVVIGWLVSATLLTLLVLPILYAIVLPDRRREMPVARRAVRLLRAARG